MKFVSHSRKLTFFQYWFRVLFLTGRKTPRSEYRWRIVDDAGNPIASGRGAPNLGAMRDEVKSVRDMLSEVLKKKTIPVIM